VRDSDDNPYYDYADPDDDCANDDYGSSVDRLCDCSSGTGRSGSHHDGFGSGATCDVYYFPSGGFAGERAEDPVHRTSHREPE
jgi:hypothetical protein